MIFTLCLGTAAWFAVRETRRTVVVGRDVVFLLFRWKAGEIKGGHAALLHG